jgi:hypothetical protein
MGIISLLKYQRTFSKWKSDQQKQRKEPRIITEANRTGKGKSGPYARKYAIWGGEV